MRHRQIDPGHTAKRNVLRIAGPLILLVGALFLIVGVGSFFMSFGGFGPPRYFWCVFVGMPLIFIGKVMSVAGFAGAVARYQAGEYAPVAKDTFNYIADESEVGVRTLASAVGQGLRGETNQAVLQCPACGSDNDPGSKYCDQCGGPLPGEVSCPGCGEINDHDARFCDRCGRSIADA